MGWTDIVGGVLTGGAYNTTKAAAKGAGLNGSKPAPMPGSKSLGWNPWEGPKKPLGPYESTVGGQDSLYRDPSSGDSPWLGMQKQQITARTGQDQDRARTSAASAGASAWNQLAQMGGVRSGTGQNIAENAAYTGMLAAQDAGFQGSDQMMSAGLADAEKNANNQRFDVTNRIADAKGRNDYKANKYGTEMQAWSAGQLAKGMNSQTGKGAFGKGGFLGLGI